MERRFWLALAIIAAGAGSVSAEQRRTQVRHLNGPAGGNAAPVVVSHPAAPPPDLPSVPGAPEPARITATATAGASGTGSSRRVAGGNQRRMANTSYWGSPASQQLGHNLRRADGDTPNPQATPGAFLRTEGLGFRNEPASPSGQFHVVDAGERVAYEPGKGQNVGGAGAFVGPKDKLPPPNPNSGGASGQNGIRDSTTP